MLNYISCFRGYKLYEQLCLLHALTSWQHWHPRKEPSWVSTGRKFTPLHPVGVRARTCQGVVHTSQHSRKQKDKCWKNKLFSQSNIQDVFRSRGFWTPWVDQSYDCLYSGKMSIIYYLFCFNLSTKDWYIIYIYIYKINNCGTQNSESFKILKNLIKMFNKEESHMMH